MARQNDQEDDYQDPYQDPYDPGPGTDYGQFTTNAFDDPEIGGDVGPGAGTGGYPPLPDGTPGGPGPTGTPPASTGGRDYEGELRARLGGLYTPGALEELQHRDYDPGWMDRIVNKELLRGSNSPGSTYTANGKGGTLQAPRVSAPGGYGGGFESFGNPNLDAMYQMLLDRLGGSSSASSSTTTPGGTSALHDQILSQLSQLITEGSQPIGDVSQSKEALAYRGALDRGSADTRSAMAERLAAQGINNGGTNLDTTVLGIKQDQANAQAQYEAGIAHNLLMDRKDRLEKALSLGAGIVSDEQRLAAQQQLAQTNTALSMFQSLLGNQYNYDYLGYLLGSQEASANAGSV